MNLVEKLQEEIERNEELLKMLAVIKKLKSNK
jgi:hypothetical protein